MLRITTGIAKNKKLETPDIPGYRAVQEISKMAVFSILGDKIINSNTIDLFAGSGNIGIEALSRGALYCHFVDENPIATACIERNLFSCGFFDNFLVTRKNVLKYLETVPEKKYAVIFADPFYKDQSQRHFFKLLPCICGTRADIFFFHSPEYNISVDLNEAEFELVDTRKYGNSSFSHLIKK